MSDDFPAHFDLEGRPIVRNTMASASTYDARCQSPEGWPCYDPTCPVEGHRHRGKAEQQRWQKLDGETRLGIVLEVDHRGVVEFSEAAIGQLLLDAGWGAGPVSGARLVKITDNVWVDPAEVVAIHAERPGTRIHLYAGDGVHTTLTVDQVLEQLRRQDRQVTGQ